MNRTVTSWQTFSSAPHRVMFFAGAVQGVATIAWWLAELLSRYQVLGSGYTWVTPAIWAHAYLMVYGFFPFFIFGFLFTTYPNWMNGEKISRRAYLGAFLTMAGGVALFYIGLVVGKWVMALAVASMLAGWAVAVIALLRVLMRSSHADKRHATVTSVALIFGWLGMLAYFLWLLTGNAAALNGARVIGIWFFLLPVVVTVSHRMIPFFSSSVLKNYVIVRPYGLLWLMLACIVGHGALELAGAYSYLWLCDVPLAIAAFYLSAKWGFLRSFQVRMLAVLHVAFLWLGLAMSLYAVQSLLLLVSSGRTYVLGLAPLHALTIGLLASIVLAMASRVTLGHSGRELVADGVTWALFLGFQATAVVRVLGDTALGAALGAGYLYIAAAVIWLVCYAVWAMKYAPVYWRPRVDHKLG